MFKKTSKGYHGWRNGFNISIYKMSHGGYWVIGCNRLRDMYISEGRHVKSIPTVKDAMKFVKEKTKTR